jgi:hypothetical protein
MLFAGLAAAAGGCSTTIIDVKGTAPDHRMKLAVMDFSDAAAYKAARDYSLGGAVGAEHPGVLLARAFRRALAKCPECDVMLWTEMRRILKADREVRPASDAEALSMGKKLAVEAVIVGEVEAYKQSWVLPLYGWASVVFTARCLDVGTGKELWRAHVKGRRSRAIEEDLAADLCVQMHERLHAKPRTP